MQSTRNDTKNRPAAFARSKIKVARIRNILIYSRKINLRPTTITWSP